MRVFPSVLFFISLLVIVVTSASSPPPTIMWTSGYPGDYVWAVSQIINDGNSMGMVLSNGVPQNTTALSGFACWLADSSAKEVVALSSDNSGDDVYAVSLSLEDGTITTSCKVSLPNVRFPFYEGTTSGDYTYLLWESSVSNATYTSNTLYLTILTSADCTEKQSIAVSPLSPYSNQMASFGLSSRTEDGAPPSVWLFDTSNTNTFQIFSWIGSSLVPKAQLPWSPAWRVNYLPVVAYENGAAVAYAVTIQAVSTAWSSSTNVCLLLTINLSTGNIFTRIITGDTTTNLFCAGGNGNLVDAAYDPSSGILYVTGSSNGVLPVNVQTAQASTVLPPFGYPLFAK